MYTLKIDGYYRHFAETTEGLENDALKYAASKDEFDEIMSSGSSGVELTDVDERDLVKEYAKLRDALIRIRDLPRTEGRAESRDSAAHAIANFVLMGRDYEKYL